MPDTLNTILVSKILLFCLILFRVTAMLLIMPMFGHKAVPLQVRGACGFMLTLIIFPVAGHGLMPQTTDAMIFLMLAVREVMAGLIIGFATIIIFTAVQLAGEVIGRNMGFGLARVLDPTTNQRVSLIARFQYILAMMIFLAIDGHHWLIAAISKSFEIVPPGAIRLEGAIAEKPVSMVG